MDERENDPPNLVDDTGQRAAPKSSRVPWNPFPSRRTSSVPGRCHCSSTTASSNALAHSHCSFSLFLYQARRRGRGSTTDARRVGQSQQDSRENSAGESELRLSFADQGPHDPRGRSGNPTSPTLRRNRSLSSIGDALPPSDAPPPSSPSSTSFIQTQQIGPGAAPTSRGSFANQPLSFFLSPSHPLRRSRSLSSIAEESPSDASPPSNLSTTSFSHTRRASENSPSSSLQDLLSAGSNLVPGNDASCRESASSNDRQPTLSSGQHGDGLPARRHESSTGASEPLGTSQQRSSTNVAAPDQSIHQARQRDARASQGRSEAEATPGVRLIGQGLSEEEERERDERERKQRWRLKRLMGEEVSPRSQYVPPTSQRSHQASNFTTRAPVSPRWFENSTFARKARSRLTRNPFSLDRQVRAPSAQTSQDAFANGVPDNRSSGPGNTLATGVPSMSNGTHAVSSTSQRPRVAAAAANHESTEEADGHATYAVAPQGGAPPDRSSNVTRHEPVRAKIV
jgi:hypothetical protein